MMAYIVGKRVVGAQCKDVLGRGGVLGVVGTGSLHERRFIVLLAKE